MLVSSCRFVSAYLPLVTVRLYWPASRRLRWTPLSTSIVALASFNVRVVIMELPSAYPVEVPIDSPVLRGLTPVPVENRDPLLPLLYEYSAPHPYHRLRPPSGRTYVYLVDPSPKGKALYSAIADSMKVPPGPIAGLKGLVQIQPGDAVLARSIYAAGDPSEDCLQILGGIMLTPEDLVHFDAIRAAGYSPDDIRDMVDKVIAARNVMLGSREDRVANRGRAKFERHSRARPLKNAPRCYGLNNMVQQPRRVESTPATLKTFDDEHDWYQVSVQEFLRAATKFITFAWKLQGPSDLLRAFENYAEQVNLPALGDDENRYWGPQQLNCASAQKMNQEHKLDSEMGPFGGEHEDENDFTSGHSCALGLSDLSIAVGCEPGRLHFVGIGVWWKLDFLSQLFFTGLLRHGGTAPLIPHDQELNGWEIRMLLISYPSTASMTGQAKHPIASLPYETLPFHVTPEMTGAPAWPGPGGLWSNYCTYAQDTWVGMTPRAHMNFLARALYQFSHWVMQQVPAYYRSEIDPGSFLRAFSIMLDDERIVADPWPSAPNRDVRKPFTEEHKAIQHELLVKQYNRLMQGIPLVQRNVYEDWDVTKRDFGFRSDNRSNTSKGKRRLENVDGTEDVTAKRICTREVLVSHVNSQVVHDFPVATQKLSYMTSFPGVSSSSTCTVDSANVHSGARRSARLRMLTGRSDEEDGSSICSSEPLEPDSSHAYALSRAENNVGSLTDNQLANAALSDDRTINDGEHESDLIVGADSRVDLCSRDGDPLSVQGEEDVAQRQPFDCPDQRPRSPEISLRPRQDIATVSTTTEPIIHVPHQNSSSRPCSEATTSDGHANYLRDTSSVVPRGSMVLNSVVMPPRRTVTLPTRTTTDKTVTFSTSCPTTGSVADVRSSIRFRSSTSKNRPTRESRRRQFVETLTTSALDRALDGVAVLNIRAQSNEVLVQALSAMDTIDLKYDHDPDPALRLDDLAIYSASIRDLKDHCQGAALWINMYRQRLMLSEYRVMDGICRIVDEQCPAILAADNDNFADTNWLTKLVINVKSLVRCGVTVRVNSKDYVSLGTSDPIRFMDEPDEVRRRKNIPVTSIDSVTLSYIRRILHTWFGGCSAFFAQARASLVRVLVDRLGTGCLLLPEVWQVYEDLPNWVFASDCPRIVDANMTDAKFLSSYLDDLDLALVEVTLCNPSILTSLDELQSGYIDIYTKVCSYAGELAVTKSKGPQLKKLLASITSDIHARRRAKKAEQSKKAESFVPSGGPPAPCTSSIPSAPAPPPSVPEPSTQIPLIIKLLEDAYHAASAQNVRDNRQAALSKPQLALVAEGDFLLPIRELAPSRAVMNRELDRDFAGTREGLFSLQIFRFIHFNSVAFRDCPGDIRKVMFTSIAEYEEYLQALRSKFPNATDSHFCNPKAHGSPVPERKLNRYIDFWEVSRRTDLAWPPPRNFATAYNFYMSYEPTVVRNGTTYNLWIGVGPLTRYLFVADLYAAGLLDPPSVDDIALAAATLRKGAMRGLILTGFLPKGGTKSQILKAFRAFYHAVSSALSPERIAQYQWNPITAEHTLCKFSRMCAKKFYCLVLSGLIV
ncbi:hypothetical protein BC629DRAFT_1593435 [Irpex lacteus]|nr:hypothetical protein BC629DRAFT_1593435 [Irpex lacteus]